MTDYTFEQFTSDLKAAVAGAPDDRTAVRAAHPLVERIAVAKDAWLKPEHYECDEDQGFGVHLLHEEPDHSLAVFAFSWLPGRGAPPHDHATWGVVAGVDGPERNVNWDRLDDGSVDGKAELKVRNEHVVQPGEVASFLSDDIHSVHNDSDSVTVSFHVYGRHINHTGRSSFDPDAGTVERFIVSVE